jgi:glycosyltransferase involved in cell wall biosynthesis
MKVLLIGNLAELSGWSEQARNHAIALDTVGVDVACRNIKITGVVHPNLPDKVKELSHKPCKNPDVVILNTLPALYEHNYHNAKHLGFFTSETSDIRSVGWTRYVNLMDHVIVPCYYNKITAEQSGVKRPIHVVPEAIDINKFAQRSEIHGVRKQFPNDFIFYTISELTQRKNLAAIIKAFHIAFDRSEPAQLFIKLTPAGLDNPQQRINEFVDSIQSGLKLYKSQNLYKRINFLCDFSNENEIVKIHQSCDAFVCASRGEAFCIPLVEAMAAGKIVVSPNHSGLDYVNDKNAFVVASREDACFGAIDTLPDLYTSRELWHEVSVTDLSKQMRLAYETRNGLALKKRQQAKIDSQKFSYQKVGEDYKKVLRGIIK